MGAGSATGSAGAVGSASIASAGSIEPAGSAGGAAVACSPVATVVTLAPSAVASFVDSAAAAAPRDLRPAAA